MDHPTAFRSWKSVAATVCALAAIGMIATSFAGCSGDNPSEFSTKDLPENMKMKPEDQVTPSGNTFKNPRDAGAGAPTKTGG